jgi:hypothetical protein
MTVARECGELSPKPKKTSKIHVFFFQLPTDLSFFSMLDFGQEVSKRFTRWWTVDDAWIHLDCDVARRLL